MNNNPRRQKLKLNGSTVVFVDWANVFGWQKATKKIINPKEIFEYFSKYVDVKEINFYFGTDRNIKSKTFLDEVKDIGFNLSTKDVKYIKIQDTNILQRKCDFDLEIALDCFENLDTYKTFIFLSGDGDFATLYERLIKKHKQVIVIYEQGHLGKEVWDIKKGVFKTRLSYLLG